MRGPLHKLMCSVYRSSFSYKQNALAFSKGDYSHVRFCMLMTLRVIYIGKVFWLKH
jgi:hypothetical protein